jgi:hypothetical protein
MGPCLANHLQVLLERASGPLADPYQTGLGRPLGSPASNSLETPCSMPPEGNMRFPPLPPCGKATKGRTIKVETVLDRPVAPCRGSRLLSHQATAELLTTSTNLRENSKPNHAPVPRPGRMREQQGRSRHRKRLRPQRSQTTPPRPWGLHPVGALARTHRNKI